MIRHHEFWPPRLFEAPAYVYLLWQCLRNRVSVRDLARADYALDHGEIGLGSKYQTQQHFDARYFPATEYLSAGMDDEQRLQRVESFAGQHGFPLILKPDIGLVGKGILKLFDAGQARRRLPELQGNYLLQSFCDLPLEFGLFYMRQRGVPTLSGINQKHFPAVTGNGRDSILQLAEAHPRFTAHWSTFLQYIDTTRVPVDGEEVVLSFIGSHTMGCLFSDASELATDELQQAVFDFYQPVAGYNYGRMDVKASSVEALQRGEFTVIEVNGVSSLPTHMFDPDYSLREAYRIFFYHVRKLAEIASEHKHRPMELMPLLDIARKVRDSQRELDEVHARLKQGVNTSVET